MAFPITTARPSYHVGLHALDRYANVFYAGETVAVRCVEPTDITWDGPYGGSVGPSNVLKAFTGNYYVRDYYGNEVARGTLTAGTTITLGASLPCGWYKIFLTQATNDATYGLAGGSGTFVIFPVDSRFPSLVGLPLAPLRRNQGASHYMRGAMMHGPYRYVFLDVLTATEALGGNASALDVILTSIPAEQQWYLNPTYADAVRPRRSIVSFVANAWQTTAGQNAVTFLVDALCDAFGPDKFWFEGPANEPSGTGQQIADHQKIVYDAIKAGNASAMVIGPCPVSINAGSRANNAACMAAMAAMTPVPIEGISHHSYNNFNGDLSMGRLSLENYEADLVANGLDQLPRFQTEQSFKTTANGNYMVRFGARWDLQMFLLYDQFNLPKEHCHLWYDMSTGFWAVPHFWEMPDHTLLPPPAMLRTLSAELWGKTFLSALDFGTPGNDMMLGNRYHDATTGNDVIALMAAGTTDSTIQFGVTGAASLTLVDCFGNTSTLTVADGRVTVPTKLEPVYLRVPSGVTVTLVPKWTVGTLASNLASATAASSSGGSANKAANLPRVINGEQENAYYYNVASTRNNVASPYFDDTDAFPATLTLTTFRAQRYDRVVVFASPPWQAQGTLLDFDVQTWNGSAWVTQATITEPVAESTVDDVDAVVFPFVDYQDQGGCVNCSFFSDRWIFDVPFAEASTTAVRLLIRNATYGMQPTLTTWNDSVGDRGTFGNNFVIREVQLYCSDLAVRRVVLADA